MVKKILTATVIFLSLVFELTAQSFHIDYYGIKTVDVDSNMLKVTSDLYYSQLCEIQNFTITDKRQGILDNNFPDTETFAKNKISFYTEINKKKDKSDSWITIYHVFDQSKGQEHTQTKEYDSFYKILMEPKQTLQDSIKKLIESNLTPAEEIISNSVAVTQKETEKTIVSTDLLSGTWSGEKYIDKIVIMRGGRGFVVFSNGATMNITVKINSTDNEHQITITQKGNSNASYFPELPRNIALKAAISAPPVEWSLKLVNQNTLAGIKTTLVQDSDSYKKTNINVEWKKIN